MKKYNIQLAINFSLLGIVIIAIIIVINNIGTEIFLGELSRFSLDYILLLTVIFLSSYILRSYRFEKLLLLETPLSLKSVFPALVTAQTTNNFLPARMGDFFRIYFLKRNFTDVSYPKGIAALSIERIEDISVLILFSLSGIILFGYSQDFIPLSLILLVTLGFFLGISIFFWLFWKKGEIIQALFVKIALKLTPKNKRLAKITQRSTEEFIAQMNSYLTDNFPVLIETTIITSIIWIIEALICYFLFVFAKIEINFFLILFAISVANMSLALPTTPGGVGIYELILATIIFSNGINEAVSLGVALLDHGIKIISISILGVIFYLILYFRISKEKNQ